MEKQMCIAITGTNGAGKTSILGKFLENHGFTLYSISDVIVAHARKASKLSLHNRDEVIEYANMIREDRGGDFFLRLCVEKARQENNSAVFESIRTVDEVTYLKNENILFLSIDAPPFLRLKWMKERGSFKDDISPADFVRQEAAEAHEENWKQNLLAVKELADMSFYNNTTPEDVEKKIQKYLYSLPGFLPRTVLMAKMD